MPTRRLVRQVAKLVESARVPVPCYGRDELTEADLQSLLGIANVILREETIEAPFFLVPSGEGETSLFLGEGLPEVVRTFLILRAIGRHWPSTKPRDLVAADVFALHGVVHMRVREDAADAAEDRVDTLHSIEDIWTVCSLSDLLSQVDQVLPRLLPAQDSSVDSNSLALRAQLLYEEARSARKRAEFHAAEKAFRSAIRFASRAEAWEVAVSSLIGIGKVFKERGSYPRARAAFLRALRGAREHELRAIEGGVLHELFILAMELNHDHAAIDFAREAHDVYGPAHPRMPWLAHDVGYFWIMQGDFRRALPLLCEVLRHPGGPADMLLAWGNLARAAGGVGNRALFSQACAEIEKLAAASHTQEYVAQSFLGIGYGARSLVLWEQAEEAAGVALKMAIARREAKVRFQAEALIDSLRAQFVDDRPRFESEQAGEEKDLLAEALLGSLRERKLGLPS